MGDSSKALTACCHCGAVRLSIASTPEKLVECNCSICHRYGAIWAYYPEESVTISASPDGIARYVWGDGNLAFCHCVSCGCVTHYEMTEKAQARRIALNARMLPSEDIAGVAARKFDGRTTWKYLD